MMFTMDQFFNVFAQYNTAVWPLQILFYLLAIAALAFTFSRSVVSDRLVTAVLAFLWAWMGLVYHLAYFSRINPAAYVFGGLFLLQAVLFFSAGVLRHKLSFRPAWNLYSLVGGFFLLYGLLIYPLLGYFLGHVYPHSPTFGLPCPTTIFTFGLLLWTDHKLPKTLLVVPLLWSLLGFSAAFQWDVLEDIMLLVAGLTATGLLVYRDARGLTGSYSASS